MLILKLIIHILLISKLVVIHESQALLSQIFRRRSSAVFERDKRSKDIPKKCRKDQIRFPDPKLIKAERSAHKAVWSTNCVKCCGLMVYLPLAKTAYVGCENIAKFAVSVA